MSIIFDIAFLGMYKEQENDLVKEHKIEILRKIERLKHARA